MYIQANVESKSMTEPHALTAKITCDGESGRSLSQAVAPDPTDDA